MNDKCHICLENPVPEPGRMCDRCHQVHLLTEANAKTAATAIGECTSPEALLSLKELETNGKNRKTVLNAIRHRLDQLDTPYDSFPSPSPTPETDPDVPKGWPENCPDDCEPIWVGDQDTGHYDRKQFNIVNDKRGAEVWPTHVLVDDVEKCEIICTRIETRRALTMSYAKGDEVHRANIIYRIKRMV